MHLKSKFGDNYHGTYRSIVGALLWIAVSTRPDISFAVIQTAKFVSAPTKTTFEAVIRILRYLKGTRTFGLSYSRKASGQFSDADWGGDPDTYRSTSGTVFILFGAAVCWRARLQKLIALSTCEAELYALCETMKQAMNFGS